MHKVYVRDRPWCVLGDFNVSLTANEKSIGSSYVDKEMQDFQECVDCVEFTDVKSMGMRFTWNKKPYGEDGILKKIDRTMANQEFYEVGGTSLFVTDDLFYNRLSNEAVDHMVREVTSKEIRDAIFAIGDNKAPGPDGYSALFFKESWNIIASDVTKAVKEFFTNGVLLKELNHTIIALIPKVNSPMSINDYRPISCCNVLLKCISSIIANRMKDCLQNLVSLNQFAFVSGRRIFDNILLIQELMHNYHLDRGVPRCAFKVDIQKAYDTVDWNFLRSVLGSFGFHTRIIGWIMECVTSTSFSISINGCLHGYFKGKRSLRQGDPISLYLFTLIMEVLTLMLHRRVWISNTFTYHRYCANLNIINLCFADDLFLFAHGDVDLAWVIMESLDGFKEASGLTPSIPKSKAYFCNVLNYVKLGILNILLFEEANEKSIGSSYVDKEMQDFQECVDCVEFTDVKSMGMRFTWNKKPYGEDGILKKIDRTMANQEFYEKLRKELDEAHIELDYDPNNIEKREMEATVLKAFNDAIMIEESFLNQKAKVGGTSLFVTDDLFYNRLSNEAVDHMVREVTSKEIRDAIFAIGDNKAPGPDGYSALFFKESWNIIASDVTKAVKEFFTNGVLLKDIIANRMKDCLQNLVSLNQFAFVSGRRIFDNILLIQELMHNYHLDRGVPRCAFKVDIQKAYDTVDWNFLRSVLGSFGFHTRIIGWIMECVTSTSFSISINGCLHGYFKGKRSLRQGDPISLYLFTLIMEVLTLMLHRRVWISNTFTYHRYCANLNIINLCFADDLFLFAHGDVDLAWVIMESLDGFKEASGLTPSIPKSFLWCQGDIKKGKAKGKRGLRQGDPISPYLFTLIMEVLTLMLHRRVWISNTITYHWYCANLNIINLCFSDDLFLFAHGDVDSAQVIMESLDEFKEALGLTSSIPKSKAYFCNVLNYVKLGILNILPFFFTNGVLLKELNQTIIALISKVNSPMSIND
nr:hypothetical protein [Tanacetum cinerariifolium]